MERDDLGKAVPSIRELAREPLGGPCDRRRVGGFLGIVVAIADDHVGAPSFLQYSPSTASAVLAAIVGAAAALTGFVVTVTVLVVQMAMGRFSARVMRLWYRDPLLKLTLAVLVGTLTFSFSLLRRIDATSSRTSA